VVFTDFGQRQEGQNGGLMRIWRRKLHKHSTECMFSKVAVSGREITKH